MANWRIEVAKPGKKPTYNSVVNKTFGVLLPKEEAEQALVKQQQQHVDHNTGATLRLISPEEWDRITGWTGPTCPDCGRPMVIEGKTSYCEYCEG